MIRALENINWRYLIISSIFIAALSAINIYVSIAILAICLLYLFLHLLGERIVLFFIIVTFLTITHGFNPALRVIVQIINIVFLLYLFIKKFGFNISKYPKVPRRIRLFVICLIALMFLCILFSDYSIYGWPQLYRTIQFFLIVYLLYSLIHSFNDIKLVLFSLIVVSLIYTIILWINFHQSGYDLFVFLQRFFAAEDNIYVPKNSMGGIFAASIPILLALPYSNKSNKKVFYYILTFIILSGLLLTNSRGAIVAMIIGGSYVLYKLDKKKLSIIIVTFAIILLVIILTPIGKTFELFLRLDTIASGRDYILETTVKVIQNNFWLGVGPAGTRYEMYKHIPFIIGSPVEKWFLYHLNQIEFGHAHNFYLFFLTDLGLGGFLLALSLPVIFLKTAFKSYSYFKTDDYFKILSIGIIGGGISSFIRGIFEWSGLISFGFITNDLPFWLLFIVIIFQNKNRNSIIC